MILLGMDMQSTWDAVEFFAGKQAWSNASRGADTRTFSCHTDYDKTDMDIMGARGYASAARGQTCLPNQTCGRMKGYGGKRGDREYDVHWA